LTILLHNRILDSIEAYFALSPHMQALALEVPSPAVDQGVVRTSIRAARDTMLSAEAPARTRDAIWPLVVQRAHEKEDPWEIVAIWMMIPGLRKICWRCHRHEPPLTLAELETEAVHAFVEALSTADVNRPELGSWLWWATYRNVQRAVSRLRRETPTADFELIAMLDASPYDASRITSGSADRVGQAVPVVDSQADQDLGRVEGERLGSMAQRLGLKHVLRPPHSRADGEAA
jgi:hypothetical protein